jgi:hypothetical protein
MPAVPAKNFEVGGVRCPYFASILKFSHAHKASVSEVHGHIPVLFEQICYFGDMVHQLKVEDQIAAGNQFKPQARVTNQERQLVHYRFTSMKGSVNPKLLDAPTVVLV